MARCGVPVNEGREGREGCWQQMRMSLGPRCGGLLFPQEAVLGRPLGAPGCVTLDKSPHSPEP